MIDPSKDYDALLIDTSIYDRNKLRLEKGLLRRLYQFKNTPIVFLLPDVIKNEVHRHLEEKIRAARNALEKSLSEAEDQIFFEGSNLNDARTTLIDGTEIEGLADSRLANFIDNTGALILNCGDHASGTDILDRYFMQSPPFDKGKKSEFPDAFTLLAVESWAEANGKQVLAVSGDNDWASYCTASPRIDLAGDLPKALDKFNHATAPYALAKNIEEAIANGTANEFLSHLSNLIEKAVDGITPEQDASSYHYWEADGATVWFSDFDFSDDEFYVIEAGNDFAVLEGWVTIHIQAEGDFSVSIYDTIDKEHTYAGSVSASTEAEFQSQILITISGDLTAHPNELSIDDVEILDPIRTVHFGDIEPDLSGDDEYE